MLSIEFDDYLHKKYTKHKPPRKRGRNALHKLAEMHNQDWVVDTALAGAAQALSQEGCTLTQLCSKIGSALQSDLENYDAVKLGTWFINFLEINELILLTQLPNQTWMAEAAEGPFKDMVSSLARSIRIQNITEQPRPWVKPWSKGVPIVKYLSSEMGKNYTIEQMPEVYKALNYLQDTEWTINSGVLSLMCDGLDGFSPEVVDEDDANQARKQLLDAKRKSLRIEEWVFTKQSVNPEYKQYARKWAGAIGRSKFKDLTIDCGAIMKQYQWMVDFIRAVELAIQVEHEPLFFQHNCDSRGRMYALSNDLSPQGPDYHKALLRFADSSPVDEHWVKIHVANCAGKDKLSYAERVSWFDTHQDAIRLIGDDPRSSEALLWLTTNGITKEEKTKWQFIACCLEWVEYEETGEWHIPIGVDATSSGLQFLCALGKDDDMAEDVNISQCTYAPVGDVYQKVGNEMIETIDFELFPSLSHLKSGDKTLRKLVKRATMVFPYSAGGGTMGNSLHDDKDSFGDDILAKMSFTECSRLGQVLYKSLCGTLPKAASLMKAMQGAFKGYDGPPDITWRGPTGFMAHQYKSTQVMKFCKVIRDNKPEINLRVRVDTGKPSLKGHKNAISPNLIHHLDAAMMVKTICAMGDSGRTSFHAIHDCFGSHSSNVDLLNTKARESFYRIVSKDWIANIMRQSTGNYTAPEKGEWNQRDVLTSPYFLC